APRGALNRVERAGEHAIRERVVQQEERGLEQPRVARVLDAVPLQRAEVVGVAELSAQLLEDLPVALGPRLAERLDQMTFQIREDGVVVEQRVVDVQQEDRRG